MHVDQGELRGHRDVLLSRITRFLTHLPGVRAIVLFGSLAEGNGDAYSDIDIEVVTEDLPACLASCRSALERASPVEIEWGLPVPGEEWASFVFRNESVYHKLDLAFAKGASADDAKDSIDGAVTVLWEGRGDERPVEPASTSIYAPLRGSVGHFLVGQLLGAMRYVKSRKRGRSLTCWRFVSAAADWLASLLYEQAHGWETVGRTLGTWEYVELDGCLGEVGRREFADMLDFGSAQRMDRSLGRLCRQMVALATSKADACGEIIPSGPINRLLTFVESELSVDTG